MNHKAKQMAAGAALAVLLAAFIGPMIVRAATIVQTNTYSNTAQMPIPVGRILASNVATTVSVTNPNAFFNAARAVQAGTLTVQINTLGLGTDSTNKIAAIIQKSCDLTNWVAVGVVGTSGAGSLNSSVMSNFYIGSVPYGRVFAVTNDTLGATNVSWEVWVGNNNP